MQHLQQQGPLCRHPKRLPGENIALPSQELPQSLPQPHRRHILPLNRSSCTPAGSMVLGERDGGQEGHPALLLSSSVEKVPGSWGSWRSMALPHPSTESTPLLSSYFEITLSSSQFKVTCKYQYLLTTPKSGNRVTHVYKRHTWRNERKTTLGFTCRKIRLKQALALHPAPHCRYHPGGARPSYMPDASSWCFPPASTAPLPFEVPHQVKTDLDLSPPNKLLSFGAGE